MKEQLEQVLPEEIEKRSFEMISEELGERVFSPWEEPIIKRCIHTSADFEYADNLAFSEGAVQQIIEKIVQDGVDFITDTNMGKAGVNKRALQKMNCTVSCFMADEDVAVLAKENQTTRAVASMDKAAQFANNSGRAVVIAVGNAPTALVRLDELIREGKITPALVIGVPVGFVNVVAAKELIMEAPVPYIVAKGRKGGSNIAAAIVNALLYMAGGRD